MDVVETAMDAAGAQLVYLDNAATTPLLPCVHEAMVAALACTFGNPANSSHELGRCATQALDAARAEVARLVFSRKLDVRPLLTHTFPLAQTAAAVDLAAHPTPESLKVLVTPGAV